MTEIEEFDEVNDGKLGGKKCKIYTRTKDDHLVVYYVDSKNYVIGVDDNHTSDLSSTMDRFTYESSASSKLFAFDQSYRGCRESAYSVPENLCSGGSSITTGIFKTLLFAVAVIVLALHSLF